MKPFFIATTITCLAVTCLFAQSAGQKVIFRGTADTVYNGSSISVYDVSTRERKLAVIQGGRFEIEVAYAEPLIYSFFSSYETNKRQGSFPFSVLVSKPGIVQLNARMDSLAGTVVTGSPDNDVYNQYHAVSNALQKKISNQLYAIFGKAMDTFSRSNPKYQELTATYRRLRAATVPAEKERLNNFISVHPASAVSLFLVRDAVNSLETVNPFDPETLELFFNKLDKSIKETQTGQDLSAQVIAAKATSIGQVAPNFSMPDTLGKPVALYDLRGKYVLIDFWASWCRPCRMENPNVVKAFNKYKSKGFTVLGVSLDRPGGKDSWIEAIHKDNLTWTHVSDLKFWNSAIVKLYGIKGVPSNFLLDIEGRVIAADLRGEDLDKKLQEVIK